MDEPSITLPATTVANRQPPPCRPARRRRRYSLAMRSSSLAALVGLFFFLWPRPADTALSSTTAASSSNSGWPLGLELVGLGFLFALLLFSTFAVAAAIRRTWRRPRLAHPAGEKTPDAVPALPATRASATLTKETPANGGGDVLNDEQLQRLSFQRWRYEHGQLTEFPSAQPPTE
jgi:hypothetical protein